MARNICLATGRQMIVMMRMPQPVRRAFDLIRSIAAASRLGAGKTARRPAQV